MFWLIDDDARDIAGPFTTKESAEAYADNRLSGAGWICDDTEHASHNATEKQSKRRTNENNHVRP